ncbi:histidine kinase [Sphingobacterium oryzagri]|uniref:histidine kinase n=1 Tax=Sphingobacterium oryzagri TaxID=3025669 RepID=A0ABY7WC60_9SPHI|nr:ATP-binding protein [Sphingobacterium sp. KACC 22765]WDF67251.1 histidine kinase [Sphingobacterium sp. KACC 22765]
MSFSPQSPDGPTGEQLKDLLIFFQAFHEGPFGYLFVDENMRTIYFNEKLCDLLCVEPARLAASSIFDLLHEEEHDKISSLKERATTHFQEPLRMVKVQGEQQTFRFVTVYLKQISTVYSESDLYVLLFLKHDFNPLDASKEDNEAFYRAIIETQETERELISASLHDGVAQELYAIRISLQRFIMGHGHEEQIMPIKKMLNDTIFKVRDISNELAPAVLRDMGFHRAIDDLIFRITRADIKFTLHIDEAISATRKELQYCSYRVIQELFNNSIKHAQSTRITLTLRKSAKEVTIIVSDNGKGFAGDIESSLGLGTGLRNIRNRIKLYTGTMDMASSATGSRIQIKLYT